MLWANRNGFFYVLDRTTGQFLSGKPFVRVTWAEGFDEKAVRNRVPGQEPTPARHARLPGQSGCDELVQPVVQSADRADSMSRPG